MAAEVGFETAMRRFNSVSVTKKLLLEGRDSVYNKAEGSVITSIFT